MQVWLDDIRDPKQFAPGEEWVWVKTAPEMIKLLETGQVTRISLDHDLGDEAVVGSGYVVAKWIEENAFHGTLPWLEWQIHSANGVGRVNMSRALINAEKYWKH